MLSGIWKQPSEQNVPVDDPSLSAEHDYGDLDAPPPLETLGQEIELLRAEKAALRETLDELETLMERKLMAAQNTYAQQQEQEALLDEKSEEIRELHEQMHEHPSAAAREAGLSPRDDDLLALSEELEYERRQLRDDEAALTAQMREMEVQMSRERAELARQRHDLQRLHGEIVHELDRASRHAALSERLRPLQRRHHEMLDREGPQPTRETPPAASPPQPALQAAVPPPAPPQAVVPPPVAPPVLAQPPAAPVAVVPTPEAPPAATPPQPAPAAVPLSELPPAPQRPVDDENDLLQRLFG